MTPAIRVESLGKCYRVNHAEERLPYNTVRDTLSRIATAPIRRWRAGGYSGIVEKFWALQDVAFEIEPGEVVGVIGRNGAGKSTLLKILSRITKPTLGHVKLHGRVGSLLEVGTGFHPELTGRENIYMNGSILGMSRREIRRKFDEIIDFAEVETFIDTVVKRYSSGMQVRLAFAVAAHLEPEILIVDEVLAVGDTTFQQKCLGRMQEIGRSGRTILFVSHNMAAVENLCGRCIVLDAGKVKCDDNPQNAIAVYYSSLKSTADDVSLGAISRKPPLYPVFRRVTFLNASMEPIHTVPAGDPLVIKMDFEHKERLIDPHFGMIFETSAGTKVFWLNTRLQRGRLPDLPAQGTVFCHIDRLPLVPGTYAITFGCGSSDRQLDYIERACHLEVTAADYFGTGRLPSRSQAVVLLDSDWTIGDEPAPLMKSLRGVSS